MLFGLRADTFLLKDTEEVIGVHDVKGLLFRLAFHVLLVNNLGKKLNCAHVLL